MMRFISAAFLVWCTTIASALPSPMPNQTELWTSTPNTPSAKRGLANNVPLRILALGASTMLGHGSTDGNGFRFGLRNKLAFDGNPVNMIGTVKSGTMADNECEGWSGFRINEVWEKAKANYAQKPNLVLISVGLNDLGQNYQVDTAHLRLGSLWDDIFNNVPGVTIVAATLFPNSDPNLQTLITRYNSAIRTEVIKRQNAGIKITLVDFSSPWFTLSDLFDGSHPGDFGYLKMAAVFYQGIEAVANIGWITKPAVIDGLPDNDIGSNNCWKRPGEADGPHVTQRGSGYDDGPYVHRPNQISDLPGFTNSAAVGFNNPVPEGVFWADINGDGTDDYVYVPAASSLGLGVALSTGGGAVGPYLHFNFGPDCERAGVQFADMTGDGRDDFCCIAPDGGLTCWQNTPGADARSPTWVAMGVVRESVGHPRAAIRLADIDGDGRADYIAINVDGRFHGWRNGATANVKPMYWTPMNGVFNDVAPRNMSGWKFADLNGDHRDDLIWLDANGKGETWINQRGYIPGAITPRWQSMGVTHGGGTSPEHVVFGAFVGSGRADYSFVTVDPATKNVKLVRHRNDSGGGTQVKGDGTRFCDMRGTGSDDYIWIHPMGEVLLYGNIHKWDDGGGWNWYGSIFNANRDRKEVHFADWDGDGKCDILLVDKATGATQVWRNNFANEKFSFTNMGTVTGSATCNEGYGYLAHDLGVQWHDMDGDGRADFLCIRRHGVVSGWLNKGLGNMVDVGQIKKAENWERRHMRFADIDGDKKTDILWVDMRTGLTKGWRNRGYTSQLAAGSSFLWEWPLGATKDPTIAGGGGARGECIEFAKLGTVGRADYVVIEPKDNTAYVHFNVCPKGGVVPSTPNLPLPPRPFPGGGFIENQPEITAPSSTAVCDYAGKSDAEKWKLSNAGPYLDQFIAWKGTGVRIDNLLYMHGTGKIDSATHSDCADYLNDNCMNLDMFTNCYDPALKDKELWWLATAFRNMRSSLFNYHASVVDATLASGLMISNLVKSIAEPVVKARTAMRDQSATGLAMFGTIMTFAGGGLTMLPGSPAAVTNGFTIFAGAIASTVAQPEEEPIANQLVKLSEYQTHLETSLSSLFQSYTLAPATMAWKYFVDANLSEFPPWSIDDPSLLTLLAKFLSGGRHLQVNQYKNLYENTLKSLMKGLVNSLLKDMGAYVIIGSHPRGDCQYAGSWSDANEICYGLEMAGSNGNDGGDVSTYSVRLPEKTIKAIFEMGIDAGAIMRVSQDCQKNTQEFNGNIERNTDPSKIKFIDGYPQCFFNLPVFYASQTKLNKLAWPSSPCLAYIRHKLRTSNGTEFVHPGNNDFPTHLNDDFEDICKDAREYVCKIRSGRGTRPSYCEISGVGWCSIQDGTHSGDTNCPDGSPEKIPLPQEV